MRNSHPERRLPAAASEPAARWLGRQVAWRRLGRAAQRPGTRREVDLRWRIKESELDLYPARQLEILEAASCFVRPGGRLVYATCSPFKSEGEEVARRFLESHPGFALDEAAPIPEAARSGPGQLRVWPDLHGGGGFFAAAMCRAAAS